MAPSWARVNVVRVVMRPICTAAPTQTRADGVSVTRREAPVIPSRVSIHSHAVVIRSALV